MGDQRTRSAHIDIAKGIAILCMILGHFYVCHDVRWMNPFIYTWHMPLFFFLSGCFLRVDENWGSFTVRRIRRLIVPYVTFGLLGIFLCTSARAYAGSFDFSWLLDRLSCFVYGNGVWLKNSLWGHRGDCGVIWFLLALFGSSLIARFLLAGCKWLWGWGALPVAFLIAVVVLAYVRSGAPWLPFGVQQSFVACVYVCAGSLVMRRTKLVERPLWIIAVVGFAGWAVLGLLGFTMSLSALRIEPIWLMLTAFPIIGFVLWLSNQIASSPILAKPLLWLGKNSLGILCAHHLYLSGMGYSVCSSIVRKVGVSQGAILMLMDFVFPVVLVALWGYAREKFILHERFSK